MSWKSRYSPEPINDSGDFDTRVRSVTSDLLSSQSLVGKINPGSISFDSIVRPFVDELPKTASDGDEIRFLADSTNGVVWHFRYRDKAPSNYRWEFVGGSPLYVEVQTSEGTTSSSFAALSTAGPSVTLPLAGDYDVSLGAQASNSTAGAVAHMSYDIGSTSAVDADGPRSTSSSAGADIAIAYTRRKTGLSAVTLTCKYKQTAGGTATFGKRWISVKPVRVGRT